jgi:hypothetical protein
VRLSHPDFHKRIDPKRLLPCRIVCSIQLASRRQIRMPDNLFKLNNKKSHNLFNLFFQYGISKLPLNVAINADNSV